MATEGYQDILRCYAVEGRERLMEKLRERKEVRRVVVCSWMDWKTYRGDIISEDVDRNGTSMLFQCVTILAITVVNSAVFLQSMLHYRLKENRYIGISALLCAQVSHERSPSPGSTNIYKCRQKTKQLNTSKSKPMTGDMRHGENCSVYHLRMIF